jgi:hypothetical protein
VRRPGACAKQHVGGLEKCTTSGMVKKTFHFQIRDFIFIFEYEETDDASRPQALLIVNAVA